MLRLAMSIGVKLRPGHTETEQALAETYTESHSFGYHMLVLQEVSPGVTEGPKHLTTTQGLSRETTSRTESSWLGIAMYIRLSVIV